MLRSSLQSSDHRWRAVDSARVDQVAPVLTERRWGKVRFPLGGLGWCIIGEDHRGEEKDWED